MRNISLSALGSVTTQKINEINDLINKKEAKMNIKQMADYMSDVKKMNIARTKELIDMHVNVAIEVKARNQNIDYQ